MVTKTVGSIAMCMRNFSKYDVSPRLAAAIGTGGRAGWGLGGTSRVHSAQRADRAGRGRKGSAASPRTVRLVCMGLTCT